MVVLLQTRRDWFTSPFSYVYILKNLHMNKKLLALLFAVPGFCAAQSEEYGVLGFAKLSDVVVESETDAQHDFAIAMVRDDNRDGGWYASLKGDNVGISRQGTTKFRLVKTDKPTVYKLFCVANGKFVAYKDAKEGANKTKFVDGKNEANTDWYVVPNFGGGENKFDIFPGTVQPNGGNPSWNVYGGVNNGSGVIGHYRANDAGSAWCFETVTQKIKFFSNYDASNESYFMTIRNRYVHKDNNGVLFSADNNLEFGKNEYLFQLVGTPSDFRIYNVATGSPIGTDPSANDDNNRYRTDLESHFTAKSSGGRVYVMETRGHNIYLNFREPYLSTWNNAAAWTSRDEGSRILFTTEDGILAEAAKKLESELKAQYPDSKFGKDLGLYPQSMKSVVDNGVKLLEEAQGSSLSIAEKKQKYNEVLEYVDYLKTAPLNLPQNGDLLYIAATRDNNVKYFTSQVHAKGDVDYDHKSSEGFLTTKATKTADAVFLYTLEGKKVTLTSVATGRRVVLGERAEDHVFYPTMAAKAGDGTQFQVSSRDGKYTFDGGGHFLASDANMDYALTYNSFSAFAGLRLERVGTTLPVHIGEGGYASFWCPSEYTVPEGVTAFRLHIVDGMVRLTSIEGNVPQNTGIILKGTANTDVNLTLVPNGTTPAIADNLLQGSAEPQTLTTPVYALKKTGRLVKVTGYMPAFKAYFTATESQVRELLERGLTGIVNVEAQQEQAPIYDLSGRRVQNTTKGQLYITNGKKFIAK